MKMLYIYLGLLFFSCTALFAQQKPLKTGTLILGSQTWKSENLDVGQYRNGDNIPQATTPDEWKSYSQHRIGCWMWYGNVVGNGIKFGRLYNWYAVNDSREIAPAGWHVPSKNEWNTLIQFFGGGNGEIRYKKNGDIEDYSGIRNMANTFLIKLGGSITGGGSYGCYAKDDWINFWSSSNSTEESAYLFQFTMSGGEVRSWWMDSGGYVRCVRD